MTIEIFPFDSKESLPANGPGINGIALRESIGMKFATGSQDFRDASKRKFHEGLHVVSQP